jgi:hypothetical protein
MSTVGATRYRFTRGQSMHLLRIVLCAVAMVGVSGQEAFALSAKLTLTVPTSKTVNVPLNRSLKRLLRDLGRQRIPVTIDLPSMLRETRSTVLVQGYAECAQLPAPLPRRCGEAGALSGYGPRVTSSRVAVTRQVRRALGGTESRSFTIGLPLNAIGRRLCRKLAASATSRSIAMQVTSRTANDTASAGTTLECEPGGGIP